MGDTLAVGASSSPTATAARCRTSSAIRQPGRGDAQASWHQPDYPNTKSWVLGGLRQQTEMVANPTWRHYQYPFLANGTGGFHPRSLEGAAAEELYIRWAQFSAFGSIMQVFGAPSVPAQNAPFGWSQSVQDNFREHTHLRLRLFPYLYTHALLTRLTGHKMIRRPKATLTTGFIRRDFSEAPRVVY